MKILEIEGARVLPAPQTLKAVLPDATEVTEVREPKAEADRVPVLMVAALPAVRVVQALAVPAAVVQALAVPAAVVQVPVAQAAQVRVVAGNNVRVFDKHK